MAKFYKQPEGLLIPPEGFDKWHVAWTLENVLSGFKEFYRLNKRWPIGNDLPLCPYLPNVKTLERKFGGIVKIRQILGLDNPHFNRGVMRSERAGRIFSRAFTVEQQLYSELVIRFHEVFVRNQSRVVVHESKSVRVDFLVFHASGRFAVDIFFPDQEKNRFASNVTAKYKIYRGFPGLLYLVVANPKIETLVLENNMVHAKAERNNCTKLLTLQEFREEIVKYNPLPDPYQGD